MLCVVEFRESHRRKIEMSDYSESIEYGRTEPVSSSVVDDTSSPRMKGEPLSERQFHDHFTVSVPWSPVRSPRARVVRLADIDEDRPLPLSETPTQPERSLPAREMRMQSREAAAESKFHQPNQPKTRTDITARLRVLESLAGLREIDEEASSGSQPANEEANNRSAEASSSSSIDRNHSDESSDPSSIDRNHSDESSDPSSIDRNNSDESSDPSSIDSSSSNESNSSSSNDEDDDDDVNEQVTYFFTVLCICFSFLCVIVTW